MADDYNYRLFTAMQENNVQYAKMADVEMVKLASMTSDASWELCTRTNGTYLDCPIANFNLTDGNVMYVGMHNPSTMLLVSSQLAVPNGHFKVDFWDYDTQSFIPMQYVDVHCNADKAADQSPVNNCQMYIATGTFIFGRTLNLLKLTYDSSVNLERPIKTAVAGDSIETNEIKLEIGLTSANNALVNFNIVDKVFGSNHSFDFGLRFWPSYLNYHMWGSGAYTFRPIDHLFTPLPYGKFQKAEISTGTWMSKFTLYFGDTNKKTGAVEKEAIVHVTLDQDLQVVKFDVDLNSLPNVFLDGYEVVTYFTAHGVDNEGIFYTDSNGLEMQKRQLNYRSYYNITEKVYSQNPQNITANYYPINSAIALRDKSGQIQFTVNNDRSQAGSSLNPGQIELMQNRRIASDDNKGVYEFLNETDSYGNGIRVPATYYVQLSNLTERPSKQRLVQQKTADPWQMMFT